MQEIGQRAFWCPRCGTMRYVAKDGSPESDHPPRLPERVFDFLGLLPKPLREEAWKRGLYEGCSVNPELHAAELNVSQINPRQKLPDGSYI